MLPTHSITARRRGCRLVWAVVIAVLGCLPLMAHGQITLTEVSRFNLDAIVSATSTDGSLNARYVGNQVNSVAWNGSRLFVAGFVSTNTGGDFDNEGIIEIVNSASTGIVTSPNVQYGSRFGFFPGVNSRGYTGLALSASRLVASLDLGQAYAANVAPGMAGYDVSGTTPTQLWALNNVRGGVNPGIDPGYVVSGTSQGGAGVAWGTFGSGSTRRILNDAATGAYIYTTATTGSTAAGLEWRLPSPTMPQYARALDFDPDTGDVYGRTGNWVTKAVRTGTNSVATPVALWSTYTGSNVVGQNLAFMSNTTNGDLVVFNERSDSSYPQTFVQAINLIDSNGSAQSPSWNFLTGTASGYTTTTKTGWYDFAFDPVTQTLAIAQPQEYRVSIFKLGAPAPSTQLRWAPSDGYTLGGDGTWDMSPAQVWNGAYGPEAWNAGAQAYFGGTTYPMSAVTVAAGGVSVARGMSFVGNGYTIAGDPITLTGTSASANNLYVDPAVTATITSSIAATSGLAKSGAGTLVVGGTISGGNLSINNGTLTVAPTGVIQSSPGISILASGTLDVTQLAGGYVVPGGQSLAGAGLVSGSVTLSAGATLSPGSNLGTLTVAGDATLGSGASYNWQVTSGSGVAGSAWDLLTVGGTLAIAATSASPFKINLWSLSSTGPDVSGSISSFDPSRSYSWTIASAAGGISGFAANKFLVSTSATNGTAGFANALGGGTFSLAQSGNQLNLVFTAGTPTVIIIDVASGTQTQTQAGHATLSGSIPVLKTGGGTLVLDQANTLTGSTTVQSGVVRLANAAALGSSRIVPLAGGTLTLTPGLQATVGGLAANAGGLTDVGSGLMTVAAGLSTPDMLVALAAGRGDGSWNGASGITSGSAAAAISQAIPRTVGWLDNGDGSVTFAFAAAGDTNLDWTVDILDAANFLAGGKFDSGAAASWNEGDFGYDGVVDILDAADFLSTGLFDAGPYNTAAGQSPGVAAVPEPSGIALLAAAGLAAAGLAGSRSCRRSSRRSSGSLVVGAIVGVASLGAASGSAQSVNVFERVRLNIGSTANGSNPQYIGSNPAAIAWNGSQLFVAGFNGSGITGTAAITQVTNPLAAPGLGVVPSFSPNFGLYPATLNGRGFTGIALSGTVLASAWENGANVANGVQAYGTGDHTTLWTGTLSTRQMGGAAFDPGYVVGGTSQGGSGVASLAFGSGRRLLFDVTSGTSIYGTSNGMIINTSPVGTEWRDVAFDPSTGNIFARVQNNVTWGIRTGANSIASNTQTYLVNNSNNGASMAGQNIAFMGGIVDPAGSYMGNAVIWNNRPQGTTAGSTVFTTSMKLTTTGSVDVPITWNMLYGSTPANGNGWYDFGFDTASQTLAVMDFLNRTVSIFDLNVSIQTVASGTQTAVLSGTTAVAKQGAGTLVVDQAGPAAANTLYVQDGTFQVGSGGTSGLIGAPVAVTVSAGATLAFNRSDDYGGAFTNTIGGAGSVTVMAGSLTLSGSILATGPTTIAGGVLRVAAAAATGPGQVIPLAGGTLTLTPGLQATVGGLAANAGGLTDVGNGLLTVAAGLSTPDMLVALAAGRGDGSWNGASGITSGSAAAAIAQSIPRTVGWLDNGGGSVTVAFAAAGDTNLDWTVDILDAANFLAGGKFDSGAPASWNEGDFGYDGVVDILDAADFLSTGLFDAGPYNAAAGQSPGIAAVPEPTAMPLLATAVIAASGVAGPRCRRRC